MQTSNMHKAMIAVATAGLFSLGASAAFAQHTPQTANMSVTGTIVPAACSANFEGGGEVDFGTIRLVDLPDNAYSSLGTKTTSLSITCSSNKRVTFSVSDAQAGTKIQVAAMYAVLGSLARASSVFGLGTATVGSAPINLGSYVIESTAPTVDSAARSAMYSSNSGSSWTARVTTLDPDGGILYTAGSGTTPSAGMTFNFPLRVYAALNYGSRLQVAEDTPLNGQAVFTINYQ